MGPILQHDQKIWDQKWYGTKSATFCKDMGPKVQQKKLWDQTETWVKVMGPKVHFDHKYLYRV